jgi:hypothetical protein
MNYWNSKGTFQTKYNQLCEMLVPDSSLCDTVEGELLRAISTIYYDTHNNGFGNNLSGPFNYLTQMMKEVTEDPETLKTVGKFEDSLIHKVNQGYWSPVTESVGDPMDQMVDLIVNYVLSKNGDYTPNKINMYELQDNPPESDDNDL